MMVKRILILAMTLSLAIAFCGCDFLKDVADSSIIERSKTFDLDGVSIELTTEFLRMDFISEDFDFIIGDGTVTIMGVKVENGENDLGELTVLEFAEYFRSLMEENDPTEITDIDGIPMMQYSSTDDDGDAQTVAVMYYKAADCFWTVCFSASSEDFDEVYDDICKYAKTVECK